MCLCGTAADWRSTPSAPLWYTCQYIMSTGNIIFSSSRLPRVDKPCHNTSSYKLCNCPACIATIPAQRPDSYRDMLTHGRRRPLYVICSDTPRRACHVGVSIPHVRGINALQYNRKEVSGGVSFGAGGLPNPTRAAEQAADPYRPSRGRALFHIYI